MFGIGLTELLVICCVAVVFIQPKDLPKAARALGRLYARLGRYYRELASVSEQLAEELRKEAEAENPRSPKEETKKPQDTDSAAFPELAAQAEDRAQDPERRKTP